MESEIPSQTEFDEPQADEMRKYFTPVPDIRVLVVDNDSTSLRIVSKMLNILGYQVVTAKLGADALSLVEKKSEELELVVLEAHLPDVELYELIDKIREISKLPFSIMSADANESSMVEALERGATRYLVKPVAFSDLGGLWQFASSKSKETTASSMSEGVSVSEGNQLDEGNMSEKGQGDLHPAKRKHSQVPDKDAEGRTNAEPPVFKKKRLTWTNDLHKRFLDAIKTLGVDRARPKKILQLMNVPGLRKEKISSYLQKYRLSLKREEEAVHQSKNRHLPQTNYYRERYLPTMDMQSLNHKPNSIYSNNNSLSRSMPMPFLAPACFPSREASTSHDPKPEQTQLTLPWNKQQHFAGPGQVEDYIRQRSFQSLEQQPVTYKTNFNSNHEKGLSSFMSCQETPSGYESIPRQNQLIPPCNLQGVANITTSGLDEYNIHCSGKDCSNVWQVENGEGIFNGNGFPSVADGSSTGRDQIQYTQQDFPQQPLPSKRHDNIEAVVGKIDEPLGIPEETLEFNEDDLDLFLSALND